MSDRGAALQFQMQMGRGRLISAVPLGTGLPHRSRIYPKMPWFFRRQPHAAKNGGVF